jgi:hypothetical protein
MKRHSRLLCILLTCVMMLSLMPAANVFAENSAIVVSGFYGDATCIEKGTSMKLTASGVTPGKSVTWSVTELDGSGTDLAEIQQTGALTCILTASSESYGIIKVTATQNDSSGKKGEQIIRITNENLVTVDDTDSAITYANAGSTVWQEKNDDSYYLGTGKCVIPPEDDGYPSDAPAYAEFTFTGTGIQWIGESNYFCGVAEVYLDGEKVSTVDPFIAPSIISQFVNFSREGLPYGQHTIRIVATGLKNPASTQYPGTRVLIDAFRYIPGEPQAQPVVVLTGDDSVQPGSVFMMGICLNNINQTVYAEDITLSYDSAVFEYEGITAADESINIFTEASDGTLQIVGANVEDGLTGSSIPIANVAFRVKSGVSNITSTISVTAAEVGVMPEGAVIYPGLSSRKIRVEAAGSVNKDALSAAIAAARSVYDSAVVGLENGCYRQADKDTLLAAINAANAVYEDGNATQTNVDNAADGLNDAVDMFKATVIGPLTGDIDDSSVIDVVDLAITAYYYNTKAGDEGWNEAVKADINKDGMIDIIDLAFIAFRM